MYNLWESGVELHQAHITLSTKSSSSSSSSGRDLTRIDANVAAAMSPYLHSMLTGVMKESSSSEPVELDLTTVGLQPVVAFMYTGSLELVNVAAALHVIAVADYLMMENVKTASAQYLMAEMNPTNALQLFKDVALYSQEVADKTSTYIDVRFEEISASNDWNTLTPGEIQYWLGRDTLLVRNEDQVFEALQNWTNFDTKARTKSFKTLMLDGTIRMPYISNERLAKIRKHKLCKSIAKDLDTEAWRRMAAGGFEAACVGLDVLPRSHLFSTVPPKTS